MTRIVQMQKTISMNTFRPDIWLLATMYNKNAKYISKHATLFMDGINPLRAEFFRGNINIYLHFMSLLHVDMAQVLKIISQVRPGLTYST